MRVFETSKINHLQRLICIQNMFINNEISADEYRLLISKENLMFERLNTDRKEEVGE